jgi:cysteine desulfurase family protein (TIGR01976 family)
MSIPLPREFGVASVEEIRGHFPALERRHGTTTVAYFDGPGGTQVPRSVASAMSDYLFHHNANAHWAFPTSIETDAALWTAREVVADFLAAAPSEIVFGANMTTLTFHIARALGRGWGSGDEVVVTDLDHHANVDPWRAVAAERDIVVRSAPFDTETGELDLQALESMIGPRTRLLAIGGASNALGTINDVPRAAALARRAGALVFVDAVHSAPHVLVDVAALGCDLLACSAYKFYGPHVGILWARQGVLEGLDVPKLEPAPNEAPYRIETGTQNHEGIVGTGTAVEFLASLADGPDRRARLARLQSMLHERGQALFERLWTGLGDLPGVRRFGPPPGGARTPTLSFVVEGRSAEDVARALAGRGVFVSHGDFYATTVARRLGHAESGLVRAGCACYTTASEIDRLVAGVAALTGRGGNE